MLIACNGNNDEAKGTHVSVFACLMKGDNDDSLFWPFTGTVTIELLNQLEEPTGGLASFTGLEGRKADLLLTV